MEWPASIRGDGLGKFIRMGGLPVDRMLALKRMGLRLNRGRDLLFDHVRCLASGRRRPL
jgi:hypothetical protein